jgi:predicted secreted protein
VEADGLCRPFVIELVLEDALAKKNVTLQKDKGVPGWRACVIEYRVHSVYLHAGRIAVMLEVSKPGYEGADVRFMAVTGKLP